VQQITKLRRLAFCWVLRAAIVDHTWRVTRAMRACRKAGARPPFYFNGDDEAVDVDTRAVPACVGGA
jgi:hypothetical protein